MSGSPVAEVQPRDRSEQGDGSASNMDVSIVIVSYNTRDLTLACLQSVFDETVGLSFEVIVVDNASGDDSVDAIRKRFPRGRECISPHRDQRPSRTETAPVRGPRLHLTPR